MGVVVAGKCGALVLDMYTEEKARHNIKNQMIKLKNVFSKSLFP